MAGFLANLARSLAAGASRVAGGRVLSAAIRSGGQSVAESRLGGPILWNLRREAAGASSAWSQASNRAWSYQMNALFRNCLAETGPLLEAFWRGEISEEQLDWVLAWAGIPGMLGKGEVDPSNQAAWLSILRNSRPDLDLDLYRQAWLQNPAMGNMVNDAEIGERLRRDGITGTRANILLGDPVRKFAPLTVPHSLAELLVFRNWGVFGEDEFRKWCRALGFTDRGQIDRLWAIKEPIAPDAAIQARRWGVLARDDEVEYYLRANGYRQPEIDILLRTAKDPPAVEQILDLVNRGKINLAQAERYLGVHGLVGAEAGLVAELRNAIPSVPEIYTLWNREIIGEGEALRLIEANGFHGEQRDKIAELRREIPGASDLVRFAVREVWNPQAIADFGYDQEFPPAFSAWMKRQGFTEGEALPDPANPGQMIPAVDWAKAYWIAHWDIPSPTQIYAAFQRIRPDNIDRWHAAGFGARIDAVTGQAIPAMKPVTLDTVREVLKIHDYAPFTRDWLAAVSYLALDQRQAKLLLQQGIADRARLVSIYRDRGYTPADAEDIATALERQEEDRKNAPHAKRTARFQNVAAGEALKQYSLGIASVQETRRFLQDLGWRDDAINNAFTAMLYQQNTRWAQEFLARVKGQFCCGDITSQQAIEILVQSGFARTMAERRVTFWVCKLTCRKRELTAGQIMSALSDCTITPEVARQRLLNLGYQDADAMIFVAQGQSRCNRLVARQVEAAARSRQKQAEALQRLLKQHRQEADRIRAQIRRLTPVASLKKWLLSGRISVEFFRRRLAAMGYDQDSIQLLVWEVEDKQSAKKPSKNGQAPAP